MINDDEREEENKSKRKKTELMPYIEKRGKEFKDFYLENIINQSNNAITNNSNNY